MLSEIIMNLRTMGKYALARRLEKGKPVIIYVKLRRSLKRWGDTLIMSASDGQIKHNSIVDCAWNWDEEKAKEEAAYACRYFFRNDDAKITWEF